MAQAKLITVRIWFYSRDINLSSNGETGSVKVPKFLKHWAVILDFMSTRSPGEVNKRILYEAVNQEGFLVALDPSPFGKDEECDWEQMSGYDRQDHGLITGFNIEDKAKEFCKEFNERKQKYVATKDNCQKFVDEFLADLFPGAAIFLPPSVERVKNGVGGLISTSLNSLTRGGSAAIMKMFLTKIVRDRGLNYLAREVIEKISLNGFGKISLLSQSPLKEYMAETGTELVLTTFGETIENIMNGARGAFSWWNLLQIPVEMIVGKLMKDAGFTDLQSYGGKKLASCLTAAGVGFFAGGPAGALGSVAFWIAAEVVATFVKWLLSEIFGENFTNIFGESQTLELVKNIMRYFEVKLKAGFDAGLEWMKDYMEATQNRTKKIA